MTYQELKDRLSKCELTLSKLKDSNFASSTEDIKEKVQQLTLLKESLQIQLAEADKGMVYTDDEDAAKDLADDGANVKLTKEVEGVKFSVDETKTIAKSVGKAVAMAVKNLGDEIAHMKATNIEENSFDIKLEYRNDNEDSFSFYITDDTLHLTDFSFDKELTDVGVKPSGEAQVNVDHLANELTKHFKSLNEKIDSNDKPELKKLSKALSKSVKSHQDQKKALDKAINTEGEVSEAPIGTHYIRVEKSELMEALGILEKAFADSRIRFELNDPDTIYIHNADIHDMHDAVEEVMQNGIIVDETSIDNELQEKEETDDYGRPHVDPKGSRTFLEPDEMLPHNRFKKMAQKEDTDVGHVDDEPDMLQATAYEIATYAAKLSKKLAKYDAHDGEVDFPNWWQAKLILAKDYMSKAYHYLDSEEKQPALDQLALESFIKEGRGDGEAINNIIIDMANEDDISTREAAEEVIEHITHIFINTKGKEEVDENADYKYLTKVILDANPKMNVYYSSSSNAVNIGGVGYDKGDLVKNFNQPQGSSGKIKNNFYYANKDPQVTKKEVEKLSNGKIKVNIKKGYGNEPFVVYSIAESMNERLNGDQQEALMDLQNVLDQAAQLADEAREIVREKFPNQLSRGDAYGIFNFGTSGNQYDHTLESMISDIEEEAGEEDMDMDEGRNVDDLYDTTVHTMKRLAKKYKAGDKSVVPHLKKLTDIKKKLEQEKIKKASNIGKGQELDEANNLLKQDALSPAEYQKAKKLKDFDAKNYKWDPKQGLHLIRKMSEAGPGFKHDCAAKVVHEKYGKGNTIPEKHTLVKEGNKYVVTHYDVLFENGNTVLDVPVNELKIETTNEHWHKGYKKKKK